MLPLKEVSESCHEQTLFPGMRTPDSLAVFQRLVFCWALSLQPISSFIHTRSKGIFSTSVFFHSLLVHQALVSVTNVNLVVL